MPDPHRRRTADEDAPPHAPGAWIDARAVVAAAAVPALLAAPSGAPLAANPQAEILAGILSDETDAGGAALRALIADAASGPVAGRIVTGRPGDPEDLRRAFDCTLLPAGARVLVLAAESTLERNMTRALMTSRAFFRDLVRCSADVAWETDAAGAFVYCGAPGLAGFAPQALNGRRAADFASNPDPFVRPKAGPSDVEVRAADGAQRILRVTGAPLTAEDGAARGARGLARDVTGDVRRAAELARLQADERLKASVLAAINAELDPAAMRAGAADALREALGAQSAQLLPGDAEPPPSAPGRLVVETAFRGARNGAVVLERRAPFTAEETARAQGAAGHLGLALAHAAQLARLADEARVDPLTGLLNRRAFMEEAVRRLEGARRGRRPVTLIYFDVDWFKHINDRHGHKTGDAVLAGIGEHVRARCRAADLAVRFGGDEFGMLLEDADARGAAARILALREAAPPIGAHAGLTEPVTLSIGAAVFAPGAAETLEALIARADAALYVSKRAGRNRWTLASDGEAP